MRRSQYGYQPRRPAMQVFIFSPKSEWSLWMLFLYSPYLSPLRLYGGLQDDALSSLNQRLVARTSYQTLRHSPLFPTCQSCRFSHNSSCHRSRARTWSSRSFCRFDSRTKHFSIELTPSVHCLQIVDVIVMGHNTPTDVIPVTTFTGALYEKSRRTRCALHKPVHGHVFVINGTVYVSN
jgi:hypothetical protein